MLPAKSAQRRPRVTTLDPAYPIRWLARKTNWGCICCGRLTHLMWRKGQHPYAKVTICVECKFGACEVCG